MTQKSWFFKHRIMPKIIHHFFSLTFFLMLCVSSAFGAGYTCPTNRKYTTCNEGYYLAYSYSGTSGSNLRYYLTPRAGNACRPCSDYDTYNNSAEGSYYCEGGTEPPLLNIFTITYNLNGGSGTTPDNEFCTRGQTCTLNDGATTSFYRAGYVFKGWSKSSSATTGSIAITFTANDTVYAVWEACAAGTYKPSTANANATCSSCPALTEGFEYVPDTGLISMRECHQGLTDPRLYNENCINQGSSDSYSVMCYADANNDWYMCAIASSATGAFVAGPGAYLSSALSFGFFDIPYANLSEILSQACIECSAGTYSPGGAVTSCSACPELTDGFEYLPKTGNTSLTDCRQGIANAADVNEYCATSSETTEQFDIECNAKSDGTWNDCVIGNTWMANPGSGNRKCRQRMLLKICVYSVRTGHTVKAD